MGATRKDTDSAPNRAPRARAGGGTDPGVGPPSGCEREQAEAVDFEALTAALDPSDPPPPRETPNSDEGAVSEDDMRAAKRTLRLEPVRLDQALADKATIRIRRAPEGLAESSGRSSATYASVRPRAVPKAHEIVEDPATPAVIVRHPEDTVPSAPPKMTVPLTGSLPRRARTPTLVVRNRGPSTGQKLFAFMAMLALITAGGVLVSLFFRPQWLGLEVPLAGSPAASVRPTKTPSSAP